MAKLNYTGSETIANILMASLSAGDKVACVLTKTDLEILINAFCFWKLHDPDFAYQTLLTDLQQLRDGAFPAEG